MAPATPTFADWPGHAGALARAMLDAGDAAAALRRSWSAPQGPVRVLAVGKAAPAMAAEALRLLHGPPLEVLVTSPEGIDHGSLLASGADVQVCDHPYPTTRNVNAAERAAALVSRVRPGETLLALISGGASAHLALPVPPLTIGELAAVTRDLQRAGAGIRELNAVRKHVEHLKGGRLAARCAGRVEAYILSDVIGDPLDVIASGPTAPDPTTYAEALDVLERRGLTLAHAHLVELLRRGAAGERPETPKPGERVFDRVSNRIIASNALGVDAVAACASRLGYHVRRVRQGVEGEAAAVAKRMVAEAHAARDGGPLAWIVGGEWTVTVGTQDGVGGPSQELALSAAEAMASAGVACGLLAFSSDGRDGPTDAAGACVTHETWGRISRAGVDPAAALAAHDSHAALDAAASLLRTGPTGTNINHVAVLVLWGDS